MFLSLPVPNTKVSSNVKGEIVYIVCIFTGFILFQLQQSCKLDNCLASLFKTEYYDGKCWWVQEEHNQCVTLFNKYSRCCSKCGQKADMERTLNISRLPNTLMIYLKRFEQDM